MHRTHRLESVARVGEQVLHNIGRRRGGTVKGNWWIYKEERDVNASNQAFVHSSTSVSSESSVHVGADLDFPTVRRALAPALAALLLFLCPTDGQTTMAGEHWLGDEAGYPHHWWRAQGWTGNHVPSVSRPGWHRENGTAGRTHYASPSCGKPLREALYSRCPE